MIAQFALIIFLLTWISLEYQNNQYSQAYLINTDKLAGTADHTTNISGVGAI
jgi:hypothetical protein